MRIGSLFSGIGGLELGLEWAGVGSVAWQVERDAFCRRVLERHWPDAERFEDVRNVGAHNLPPVDVIAGGFPCQDLSLAGKGAGLHGERSGLFFELARVVRELRPRFVVLENVAAILGRGAGDVLGTLAALGYDSEWSCVRASDVGAMHRRDRWFCVAWLADRERDGLQGNQSQGATSRATARGRPMADTVSGGRDGVDRMVETVAIERETVGGIQQRPIPVLGDTGGNVAGRHGGRQPIERIEEHPGQQGARGNEPNGRSARRRGQGAGGGTDAAGVADATRGGTGRSSNERHNQRRGPNSAAERSDVCGEPRDGGAEGRASPPLESLVGRGLNGFSGRLHVAPPGAEQYPWEPPRLVESAPDRTARLRALGNAVVPQVAALVGRRLLEIAEREGLL